MACMWIVRPGRAAFSAESTKICGDVQQLCAVFRIALAQSFGELCEHGQSHRQVKPIKDALRLRVHELLQVAQVIGAIGQEGDLLVLLHPLISEQAQESATRSIIQGLDKTQCKQHINCPVM